MERLQYAGHSIVFQEVPGEITLAFEIAGCKHKCQGCHSPHLQQETGIYLSDLIWETILPYRDYITCVCFMGGDHNLIELQSYCRRIKRGLLLKTALYSGVNSLDEIKGILPHLNYVKIGEYKEELGGLSSPTTNQRFYKRLRCYDCVDLTSQFWEKNSEL